MAAPSAKRQRTETDEAAVIRIAEWNLGGVNVSPWEFKPLRHELGVIADDILAHAALRLDEPNALAKFMQEATSHQFLEAFRSVSKTEDAQLSGSTNDVLEVWRQGRHGSSSSKDSQKIMSRKNLHLERYLTIERFTEETLEEFSSLVLSLMETGSSSFFQQWLTKGLWAKSHHVCLQNPDDLWPVAAFDFATFMAMAIAAKELKLSANQVRDAFRDVLSSGFTTHAQKSANVEDILKAVRSGPAGGPDILALIECDTGSLPKIGSDYTEFCPNTAKEKSQQAVRLYVKNSLLSEEDDKDLCLIDQRLADERFQEKHPVGKNGKGVSDLETRIATAFIRVGPHQVRLLVAAIHASSDGTDGKIWVNAVAELARPHDIGAIVAIDANTKQGTESDFKSFIWNELSGCTCFDHLDNGAGTTRKTRSWLQAQLSKADKTDAALKDWVIYIPPHAKQEVTVRGIRANTCEAALAREVLAADNLPAEDKTYVETSMPTNTFSSDHCLILAELCMP